MTIFLGIPRPCSANTQIPRMHIPNMYGASLSCFGHGGKVLGSPHVAIVQHSFTLKIVLYQELIEPAKPAREHVTSAYRSINGEIQTWRPYAKSSITRIWTLGLIRVLSHVT